MKRAADEAGVPIVTGDTKVVDRGKGDGVYINTTGIGLVPEGVEVAPQRARPGDRILLSGGIAEHGIAIMSVREGLEFETELTTDSAALHRMTGALLDELGRAVHVLRDPTRGGVASALNEIAGAAAVGIRLEETAIPLRRAGPRRLRDPGLRPALRRQRGQVHRHRRPRGRGPGARADARRPAGREGRDHRRSGRRRPRAGWCSGAGSAASGSWTCSRASSCRGSADQRTDGRAEPRRPRSKISPAQRPAAGSPRRPPP